MSSTPHLLTQDTLTDLFTLVYVLVDDYLKAAEHGGHFSLPRAENQKGCYAELMTIALVGDLIHQSHVGCWFLLVKAEYRHLFPRLPDRTRYHRIQNNLERVYADLALRIPQPSGQTVYAIDSKPLLVCKGGRFKRPRAMVEAASGHSSRSFFYGFKLHAVFDHRGLVCRFAVVAANINDAVVARALLADEQTRQDLVLGDKGYQGCGVYAQAKKGMQVQRPWTMTMGWLRKVAEVVFSSLVRSQHLALGQLNSFRSVRSNVCRKIAAHNLAWFLTH